MKGFLAAAVGDPFADHLRWLSDAGQPVASVQVSLHHYPIGAVRVGVCLPEYPFVPPPLRGRGHFKRLMADLFAWMSAAGYPLAYSHGAKGLYTGIGYAPCMHHAIVLIRVDDACGIQATQPVSPAGEADIAANEELFRRPFPLGRGVQCRDERWRPEAKLVQLAPGDRGQRPRGFLVLDGASLKPPPERGRVLTITDAWAADIAAAGALLRAAAEEARDKCFEWIRLNCRGMDLPARAAILAGGEFRSSAAQERNATDQSEDVDAFYLADLPLAVEQLLPELAARRHRLAADVPPAVRLGMEEQEVTLGFADGLEILNTVPPGAACIRLPRKAMTQAILGYATPTELSLIHDGCEIPFACAALADALFPATRPHLIHEGLAFAALEDWGLVP